MAVNNTPLIVLVAGGPAAKITVECRQGPGGSQTDTTSTLGASGSVAGVATIAVSGPREVTVTPVGVGTVALFVNETPSADRNLQVNVQVDPPPSVREIVYVGHVLA